MTERLGVGPEICLERNSRLLYVRMTGWGPSGPLARTAGHDLGCLARTGALRASGQDGKPAFPADLLCG